MKLIIATLLVISVRVQGVARDEVQWIRECTEEDFKAPSKNGVKIYDCLGPLQTHDVVGHKCRTKAQAFMGPCMDTDGCAMPQCCGIISGRQSFFGVKMKSPVVVKAGRFSGFLQGLHIGNVTDYIRIGIDSPVTVPGFLAQYEHDLCESIHCPQIIGQDQFLQLPFKFPTTFLTTFGIICDFVARFDSDNCHKSQNPYAYYALYARLVNPDFADSVRKIFSDPIGGAKQSLGLDPVDGVADMITGDAFLGGMVGSLAGGTGEKNIVGEALTGDLVGDLAKGAVGAGVMPLLGATGGEGYKLHKEVGPLETHDVRGHHCKTNAKAWMGPCMDTPGCAMPQCCGIISGQESWFHVEYDAPVSVKSGVFTGWIQGLGIGSSDDQTQLKIPISPVPGWQAQYDEVLCNSVKCPQKVGETHKFKLRFKFPLAPLTSLGLICDFIAKFESNDCSKKQNPYIFIALYARLVPQSLFKSLEGILKNPIVGVQDLVGLDLVDNTLGGLGIGKTAGGLLGGGGKKDCDK